MVKKGLLFGVLILLSVLMFQTASAEIILTKQPANVYNLGELVEFPVTIKTLGAINDILSVNLLCGGHDINFYKNGISLTSGQEKKIEPSLILSANVLGELKGTCKIKIQLGGDFLLSENFKISSVISVKSNADSLSFMPGEYVFIEGDALKEDKKDVNGLIELTLKKGNNSEEIKTTESINNGFFSINLSLEEDVPSGEYFLTLSAYEKDNNGEKTNTGLVSYSVSVAQIPTSVEIFVEQKKVTPGEELKIETILHDQTGERIEGGESLLKIQDHTGRILEQMILQNNQLFSFQTNQTQPPGVWTIEVVSENLENTQEITINELASINIKILNKTILLENTGNIAYCNKTVLVDIGNQTMNINPCLGVGEHEEYRLKAPDGIYNILVKTNEGGIISAENITLSGNAISISEAAGKLNFARNPVVWIFIIAILAYVSFILYKKRHNKSFFAYFKERKKKKEGHGGESHHMTLFHHKDHTKGEKLDIQQRALLSLSMKGEKQNVSFINLKLKNQRDLFQPEDSTKETLQKVIHEVEKSKGYTYESHDNYTFIVAPSRTKTFKNERKVVELAQRIEKIVNNHNKIYKKEIDYGLSINYGPMLIKNEKEILYFTSIGTLINEAKKLAIISTKGIFISQKMNERILTEARTQKHVKDGRTHYTLKELKNNEKNSRFIKDFVNRLEKKD